MIMFEQVKKINDHPERYLFDASGTQSVKVNMWYKSRIDVTSFISSTFVKYGSSKGQNVSKYITLATQQKNCAAS